MTNFGAIDKYAGFVEQDPFRNGLHYPAVINALGNLKQRILDVGCGDGRFPRMLADLGASVVGYDIDEKMIEQAKASEERHPQGIRYETAIPESFSDSKKFDNATSVLVLPYAPSLESLTETFRSTYRNLLEKGRFISVIFNPKFQAFGKDLGSRRFTKLDGNNVQVEFLDPKSHETQFMSVLHQYTQDEYEKAALDGGLQPLLWAPLYATREAIKQLGEQFFEPTHREQPYALFEASK